MSLKKVKFLLAITQIGSVWSKNYKEIKVLKTLTALGFLALFLNSDEINKDETNEYNRKL